ncbi:hypothetical protein [Amycolatopsis sp. NPDC051371]|uniref:hypothetical protein n=1 Tax=Amycolatopsis sp. NPDC051371 TaxID=3155800 RepID=UPI00342366EB
MHKIIAGLGAVAAVLCGCSSADTSSAEEAAQRFEAAVADGGGPACALLAPRARDGLGPVGCGTGSPVATLPHAPVGSIVVWGDEAQARSTSDTLFLHDFPDGWRVTGAGCRPRNQQVYDCAVGGR